MEAPNEFPQPFAEFDSKISAIAIAPNGQHIAVGLENESIALWNNQDHSWFTFANALNYICSIAISADGETIVTGGNDVRLWTKEGNLIGEPFAANSSSISSIAISADGQNIVIGRNDGIISLWTRDGNFIINPFVEYLISIGSVAISADGQKIFIGGDNGTISLWASDGDLTIPFVAEYPNSISSIAVSADRQNIVGVGQDGTVWVLDRNGELIQSSLIQASHTFSSVAICADKEIIVTGDDDGRLWLWDIQGDPISEILNIRRTPQAFRNDQPVGEDSLDVSKELHAIADVLMLRSLQPPLAVAILGSWGSGKSFGMHLIKKYITEIRCQKLEPQQTWATDNDPNDPRLSPYVGHIYQIDFDAWSYANSNLWASLMQTIFDQLNRQLNLEKQLAAVLAKDPESVTSPLLEGGKIWQVLNQMNNNDRKAILESELSQEIFDKWKEQTSEVNSLWDILTQLRKDEQKKLDVTKAELKKLKEEKHQLESEVQLQQTKIEREVDNEVDNEALIKVLLKQLKLILEKKNNPIIRDLLINLGIKVPDLTFLDKLTDDELIDFIRLKDDKIKFLTKNIDKIKYSFEEKPNRLIVLIDLIRKDWKKLIYFIPLISLPFLAYVFLFEYLHDLSLGIKIWLTTLTSGFSLYQTLKKINLLKLEIIEIFEKTKENYQQERRKLAIEKNERITQKTKQQNPENQNKLTEVNKKIQTLEAQVEVETKRTGLTAKYKSLLDFVTNRLEEDSYQKVLGLMHQIKRDLEDLSDRLTYQPGSQNPDKLNALKEHFPRGEARIVLYIDDLDRCPPNRVVEVLEAVQLLLKTKLFIVVMAIDDRYVNRALENVYRGVLKRRGNPSGVDYLEKIIQIPYRMRSISEKDILGEYLGSLLEIEEEFNSEKVSVTKKTQPQQSNSQVENSQFAQSFSVSENLDINQTQFAQSFSIPENLDLDQSANIKKPKEELREIIKFTRAEFDLIQECCQHVDMTPRTAKRFINICKILKIIWSPTSNDRRWKNEPKLEVKQTVMAFLALAGRYPNQMRNVLEEIHLRFEKNRQSEMSINKEEILYKLQKIEPYKDTYNHREWQKFEYDFKQMQPNKAFILEQRTFNLIISFCFVGDIGYDPDEGYNYQSPLPKVYGFSVNSPIKEDL
ncbi:P-loop NTPase fold protein [Cronbergia sp. UHCC 0137]|uniref:P-loop NTPase fold protein n=1 Tax=Cronbergia sp. UHCC 0137 TaxID=3110239 RepID=UPI002B1FD720|nr:P-loop NTPase fold protein [Cronbergia sp. UHCC 0137]MEA5619091.1 P-loop NTPase fold protein [Cronbergia sp. UHCC 0137]